MHRQLELFIGLKDIVATNNNLTFHILQRSIIENVTFLALLLDTEFSIDLDSFCAFGVISRYKTALKFESETPKKYKHMIPDNTLDRAILKEKSTKYLGKYKSYQNKNIWPLPENVKAKKINTDYGRIKYYTLKFFGDEMYLFMLKEVMDAAVHGNPLEFVLKFDENLDGIFRPPSPDNTVKDNSHIFLLLSLYVIGVLDEVLDEIQFNEDDDVENSIAHHLNLMKDKINR